jgi:hypothetical protein
MKLMCNSAPNLFSLNKGKSGEKLLYYVYTVHHTLSITLTKFFVLTFFSLPYTRQCHLPRMSWLYEYNIIGKHLSPCKRNSTETPKVFITANTKVCNWIQSESVFSLNTNNLTFITVYFVLLPSNTTNSNYHKVHFNIIYPIISDMTTFQVALTPKFCSQLLFPQLSYIFSPQWTLFIWML